MAAVITRKEISEMLTKRLHFNTFGGNPVACAVGRAVLDVIDEEKIQDNCAKVGQVLKDGLLNLRNK